MDNQPLFELEKETFKQYRVLEVILFFFILIFLFLFSFRLSAFHTNGDQIHYTRAYQMIGGLKFSEAIKVYRQNINSFEPMHFILSWIGSSLGVRKNILMSSLNIFLFFLAYKYLKRKGYSYGLTLLVLLTNYYFFVMFFTLEKLKVAFIFMFLFLLSDKNHVFALSSLVASLFSHFQMIILVFLELSADFLSSIRRASMPKKKLFSFGIYFVCAFVLGMFVVLQYGSFIAAKVQFYFNFSRSQGLLSLRSIAIAFLLTYIGTEQKNKAVFYFLGLSVCILFLGSDRLNMLAYFGFLQFIDPKKHVSKISIILLSGYLLYKTVGYLELIYYYGG